MMTTLSAEGVLLSHKTSKQNSQIVINNLLHPLLDSRFAASGFTVVKSIRLQNSVFQEVKHRTLSPVGDSMNYHPLQ